MERRIDRKEAHLHEQRGGPRLRLAVRAHQSRPILERIHQALLRSKLARRFLPRSPLGNALNYTLNQWSLLEIFAGDGRIEIDNNLVENAIRPTALEKELALHRRSPSRITRSHYLHAGGKLPPTRP